MGEGGVPIDASSGSWTTSDRLALGAILAVALLVRLYAIDDLDVWVDEANAILIARAPIGALLGKLQLDSSPPLFYLLLHFWIGAFGDGVVALRGLSVLAGVGLTGATAWAGRALISRPAGAWAALFVAVSPVQAYYSQQVRMYALLPLLSLLSVAFLVRYLRDGAARDRALWLATTVLALYTHNFALYVPAVAAALILLSGRAWSDRRIWAACAGLGLLACLPWLPTFLTQLHNPDHYAWFLGDWERLGPTGVAVRTLRSFSPGAEYVKFFGIEQYLAWRGWPTLATAALAAWGGVELARQRKVRGRVGAFWPAVFLLVPTGLALVVSSWLTPHYVPGRVDQLMFPAYALLVGAGFAQLRPAPLRIVAAVALVACAGWTRWSLYPDERDPRFYVSGGVRHEVTLAGGDRAMARRIVQRWRPGDVILTTSLTRASLEYYLDRDGRSPRFVSFPRETARHLGSQNDERWLAAPQALVAEADAALAEVRGQLGPGGRLFLVRVRATVNGILKQEPMTRRFGFVQLEHLGHFGQAGTGALVELVLYGMGHPE